MSRSIQFRVLVLCALMAALVMGSSARNEDRALAQGAPPVLVPTEACEAGSDPPPAVDAPPSVGDALWDYAEGVPADSLLVQILIDDRLARFLGCINAGDQPAISTLLTESYKRRHPLPDDAATAAPLADREALTFTTVDAVRVHESGEVVVFLALQDPTYCDEDIDLAVVFRQVDGTWLVDDTAAVVDFEPVPWQPPGIRDADAPRCGEAASIAGLQPLRQPPGEDGEMQVKTAQEVISALEASEPEPVGEITLENVQVEGYLDLQGVPTDRIRAENVRFSGGIDVSLPIDDRGIDRGERPGMDFYFKDVEFAEDVDLGLDQFDKFECVDCTFRGTLNMSYVDADYVFVRGSRFESSVLFSYIDVSGIMGISDSHFLGPADLTGAEVPELRLTHVAAAQPMQITWDAFGESWIERRIHEVLAASVEDKQQLLDDIDSDLRFLENNFAALGQQRDADAAHAERLRLRHDHYHDWSDPEKWELTSIGFLTGWGADPWRPVRIILVIVVFFGGLYWLTSPFEQADTGKKPMNRGPGGLFAMLYSIDTFVPFAIVTGVRDWGWVIRGPMRWVVVLERFTGAIVSAAYAFNIGAYLL